MLRLTAVVAASSIVFAVLPASPASAEPADPEAPASEPIAREEPRPTEDANVGFDVGPPEPTEPPAVTPAPETTIEQPKPRFSTPRKRVTIRRARRAVSHEDGLIEEGEERSERRSRTESQLSDGTRLSSERIRADDDP